MIFGRMLANYDPAFKITLTFEWIRIGTVNISFGILIDNLTVVMLVVVTLVSAFVHLFSIGYMQDDVRYSRYFAYLALFSFSMLGLVLVDNFFGIYIFWELVGVCSYLLIGHWYEKKSASDAAIKAFITTRIGDLGMLIGIMIILATLGTFGFDEVFAGVADGKLSGGLLTFAGIMIFFGAIGKSAQFPLHVWLPDAMEGPTPVSALIHAATMVADGVYLVGRTFV
jgi:NADH-quinone oxidoreductase subunit L